MPSTELLANAPWADHARSPRVTRVTTFVTAPAGPALVVVQVETSEPGLIGWGCASNPQRPLAIRTVIDEYLGPLLVGRASGDIEDFHQLAALSPYWRDGAIENNALAGIDLALWDIKGKLAGMPVHQLIGGQVRSHVPVYGHADGRDSGEVIDGVRRFTEQGYEYVRCQIAIPGADTYGVHGKSDPDLAARALARNVSWLPRPYALAVPSMFEDVRAELGPEIELLHDVHERLDARSALRLSHTLDEFRLFFLEDALAPEDSGWYPEMRRQSSTPQAVGEIYSSVREFVPLITERLIDFCRIRMGAIGGLTPTIKLAHLCEFFGVRLALHGPGDVSPIGHAAGLQIDAASRSFGIQEAVRHPEAVRDVFPGAPEVVDGRYEVPQTPGLGIEYDEKAGAKYRIPDPWTLDSWTLLRREDGSVVRP
ncbi:enolase C-terminal domain-like protein [Microbacterium sp. NPDC057650]|uniref:enolase C-terminal domain-like protein n=1 Tax=unclassified Microbacterium TaxID=2609290 RepID=UPI00366BF7A7